jgi:hypothetical protein
MPPMENPVLLYICCYATTATQSLAYPWQRVYLPLIGNDSAPPEHITILLILEDHFLLGCFHGGVKDVFWDLVPCTIST